MMLLGLVLVLVSVVVMNVFLGVNDGIKIVTGNNKCINNDIRLNNIVNTKYQH